jgi:sorting nexin-1/2
VTNPITTSKDFVVYTVIGLIKKEQFEIQRRYSDFAALRAALVERFPGLYVPPVPSKKAIGNTKQSFVEERCFLLNMFIKQLSRCPYLLDSQEFAIFVKP